MSKVIAMLEKQELRRMCASFVILRALTCAPECCNADWAPNSIGALPCFLEPKTNTLGTAGAECSMLSTRPRWLAQGHSPRDLSLQPILSRPMMVGCPAWLAAFAIAVVVA